MELSIIITNYKNPDLLKVCIESVKKNITLKDYEIIVADSETEEKTEMMMEEDFPEIKFFPHKDNVGFQHLVRKGVENAFGEFVLVLNGDIIVKPNSIENLLELLKKDSSIGLAGPKLLNFNETLQYSCFRFYSLLTILYRRTFLGRFGFAKKQLDHFLMKDFDHKSSREVDWLMGSALMTKKTAIEKVGLMDDRFRMYFEDTDWCRRFWEKGYKVIYFPESVMYHYHGKGSAGKSVIGSLLFNRLTWLHIKSALMYFWKYRGKPLPAHE
jgi:hypothetical protein